MSTNSMGVQTHTGRHISGWVSFAAYLLIVLGFFHLIAGLVALFQPDQFVVTENQLLIFDYDVWGWTHLIFGGVLLAAAGALFAGRMWARVLTIGLATLSAIANFGFIWAYPAWSIMMIALDIMIIYSVAMHGGRADEYEG
jgi:hypothetical protein